MHSIILIIICTVMTVLHYHTLSIWHMRTENKFYQIRLVFCLITILPWTFKIIYSSLPLNIYSFLYTSRCLLRLFRVFIYAILLLTDYPKLFHFLTKHRELLFIICPVLSYCMFELSIGTNPLSIKLPCIIFTLLYLFSFYLLCFLITGNATFTFLSISLLSLALSLGNYFVFQFRERYISYSDIYELTAAAAVANRYKFTLNKNCIIAFLIFLISLLIIYITRTEKLKKYVPKFILRVFIISVIAVSFIISIKENFLFGNYVQSNAWSVTGKEHKYGYILSALSEIHDSQSIKPENYSVEKVSAILSDYQDGFINYSSEEPDIIVIMNESFSDLNVLGNYTTTEDPLSYFHSLNENCQKGYIVASNLGGGTSYTEFEAITGCSEAFIQGSAYARYVLSDTPSLATILKHYSNSYSTFAIHPEQPSNYYRNRAYPLLGFDNSFFISDFEEPEFVLNKVTDSCNYKFLIKQYEQQKSANSSVFFLNVTMQNHGNYINTNYQFKQPISITSFNAGPDVSEYLSLLKMSDNALEELLNYFSNISHPVIILFFGDHQPELNDDFYKTLLNKDNADITLEEEFKKHIVPFLIWANYDIQEKDLGIMSPNQLTPTLLQAAGLPMTAFNNYVKHIGNTLPVIQSFGYMDKDGHIYSYDEESPYIDLLHEYEMVQYNYLHDSQNRLEQYYNPNINE